MTWRRTRQIVTRFGEHREYNKDADYLLRLLTNPPAFTQTASHFFQPANESEGDGEARVETGAGEGSVEKNEEESGDVG